MDPVEFDFWSHAKNLQGDIVAVYNQSGVKCISYVYDAWGNTARTVHNGSGTNAYAQYNPFTYRGYYYDAETGLYYLNSRYYNPQWGRFLNADCYLNANGDILGFNMFAYCGNNPVMGYDPSGYSERLLDSLHSGGGAVGSNAYYAPIAMLGVGVGVEILGPSISQLFSSLCDSVSVAFSGIFSKSEAKAEDKPEEKGSPFFDEKYHVHHIVARNDKRAGPAQEILKAAGINRFISPENLVELPAFYHQRIHSDYYYSYVNEVIVTSWDAEGADGVHEALFILRCEIESGTLW